MAKSTKTWFVKLILKRPDCASKSHFILRFGFFVACLADTNFRSVLFGLFPTVSNVQRLSTRKFVSFHRQIQNGGLLTGSKRAKGISFTNGKWTTGTSKTFERTIRILPQKNRGIWWRIRGNGEETGAVQMHLRRTGSHNVAVVKLFRCWNKDKFSYIFASYRSTKRNGNCGKGRKKSPNYKKLWATCKFTSFKKENTFWDCTQKMTD